MNIKPKKSLGQNFLGNSDILNTIVENGNILNSDIVLEIGAGTGNLTEKILEKKPKHLIVIEKDKNLSQILERKFKNKIEIINKDILDCYKNFIFDKPIKVFGNLPYNISTEILISFLKISDLKSKFEKFILMFQKEVADRILAEENSRDYGRLSILTSWKMDKNRIININPNFFYPKPKVWSSLITLKPKLKFEKINKMGDLEHITKIFFNQRRKMIKKPMKQLFENYEEIAINLNLDLNLRPQNLSINKYLEICKVYQKLR